MKFVTLVSIVAALGGLLFGFDTAVVSGAIGFMKERFLLNDVQVGWAVSSLIIGCIAGAAGAGVLSDRFGRKKSIDLRCGPVYYRILRFRHSGHIHRLCYRPYYRRTRHRYHLNSMSSLQCGNRACQISRPSGGVKPAGDGNRYFPRLLHKYGNSRIWRSGMGRFNRLAVDVRIRRFAGTAVPCTAVFLCPRASLVDQAGKGRGISSDFIEDSRRRIGQKRKSLILKNRLNRKAAPAVSCLPRA